jgi:hypothetical protein
MRCHLLPLSDYCYGGINFSRFVTRDDHPCPAPMRKRGKDQ